jgi:DNA polymerase III epsilon subunit-like protein
VNFVAIDVETANPDFASICQVGVAAFRDGTLHGTWESLVDPEDYFDGMNVAIHGIDERAVRGAPKWRIVYELLAPWLQGHVVASHTPFERFDGYGLDLLLLDHLKLPKCRPCVANANRRIHFADHLTCGRDGPRAPVSDDNFTKLHLGSEIRVVQPRAGVLRD